MSPAGRKADVGRNANGSKVPRPLVGMIIGANEPVAIFSVRLCFLRFILKCIDRKEKAGEDWVI
jgi:hypothetical protein